MALATLSSFHLPASQSPASTSSGRLASRTAHGSHVCFTTAQLAAPSLEAPASAAFFRLSGDKTDTSLCRFAACLAKCDSMPAASSCASSLCRWAASLALSSCSPPTPIASIASSGGRACSSANSSSPTLGRMSSRGACGSFTGESADENASNMRNIFFDQCMPDAPGKTVYNPLSAALLSSGSASNCSVLSNRCARIHTIAAAASFLTVCEAPPGTTQPISTRSLSASATVIAAASFSSLHLFMKVCTIPK